MNVSKRLLTSLQKHQILGCRYTTASFVRLSKFGNPKNVTSVQEETLPACGDNDILVKMIAAPINPEDLATIKGADPRQRSLPTGCGSEGLAQVVSTGKNVKSVKAKDHVVPLPGGFNTWRTHAVTDASNVVKISTDIKPEYASCFSRDVSTAIRLLDDFVTLKKGDTIIQNIANSAVGTAVMQIAASRGLRTINVLRDRDDAANEEVVQRMKAWGGYVVVPHSYTRTPEFARVLADLPAPALALDGAGGEFATEMARHLGQNGTLVTYGCMSGRPIQLPSSLFLYKNINVRGFNLNDWIKEKGEEETRKMYETAQDMVSLHEGILQDFSLRMWVESHKFSNFNQALERAMAERKSRKVVMLF